MVRPRFGSDIGWTVDKTVAQTLLEDLEWRGLIAQQSNHEGLAEHLQSEPRTLYCGFDPTADSLHIGSLVPLLLLRRFQQAGHRPILLLGGATGLIGDPSFKDDERSLNDADTVESWVASLQRQVRPFLDFEGPAAASIVNNLDWTRSMDVISFLRDIGKHFSVNAMIQRDSVRNRLERADQGISYTEFSYMLLQSMDFLKLAESHNCTLQVGGQDQWGNIVSGVDLIRRHLAKEAFALTHPLITKADGTKFGKTAGGAVWLDPHKTSPYSFYQFWLNTADADVVNYLKFFTFLNQGEISALAEETETAPEHRAAQKQLAAEVTQLVHGEEAVVSAQRISTALFGGELSALQPQDLEQLQLDGMDSTAVNPGQGLLSVMVEAGVAKSTGEARKLVQGGGVRLNGSQVQDPRAELDFADALYGEFFVMRKGKKVYHLITKAG